MNKKKVGIVIEARTQSTRFPNKILKKIGRISVLLFLLKRISKLRQYKIVVATSTNPKDNKIVNICLKNNFSYLL